MKTTLMIGCAAAVGLSLLLYASGVSARSEYGKPQTTHHLYVTGSSGSAGPVLRYPLVDGLPAPSPDLTIPGSYDLLAATDLHNGHSTLFALTADLLGVDAFDYNQTVPRRRIIFPTLRRATWGVYGMTADADGYLYLALSPLGDDALIAPPAAAPDIPPEAIYIYGPNQNGQEKAQVTTPVPSEAFPVESITVDRTGTLYVFGKSSIPGMGRCRKYVNAGSNPARAGSFWSLHVGPSIGSAFDGQDVYAMAFDYRTATSSLVVFKAADRGRSEPVSQFTSTQHIAAPVAYFDRMLYIGIQAPNSVGIFKADGIGSQSPIEVLSGVGSPTVDFLR